MSRISILAIIFFSLITLQIYGQPAIPKDVNALHKQLRESNADTARVSILIGISRYDAANSGNKPALADSALARAVQAYQLATKLSYQQGIGLGYQLMALAWCKKKDFKKADELINKAIAVFLSNNLRRDAAEAYLNAEEIYLAAGNHDFKVTAAYYEQALPLFEKAHATLRAAATLSILGDFYFQLDNYNKAVECLKRAVAYYHAGGYPNLQNTYNLLGTALLSLNKLSEALKYNLLAVRTGEALGDTSMDMCSVYNHTGLTYYAGGKFTQSNYYFKKAVDVAVKYHDHVAIILSANFASSLNAQNLPAQALAVLKESERKFPNISAEDRINYDAGYLKAYTKLKQFDKGAVYSGRLLKSYNSPNCKPSIQAGAINNLLEYFVAAGKYDSATPLLSELKRVIVNTPFKVRFTEHLYYFSYCIDSARQNHYSALQNYKLYAVLKDSILEAMKNKQMQELQIQYETEKKEKENLLLKKESQIQLGKARQANHIRNLTLTSTIVLLILLGLLFYSYRINQKNSRAISKKNLALNQLVIEKEWLVKEIHHRVKNNLQIAMGLLQRQSAYIDNDHALAAIQNSENRMRSIALIHQKLYQSESLDLIFMPEYIDEMISYLKDSCGLDNRIFFEKQLDDIYLDVAQAVPLGLILNEAITNAIKYAYADMGSGIIYISLLKEDDGCIDLTIADNGPGLPDAFNVNKVDSLGVNLMRGLAKQLGGSFDIVNEQGCMISISFKTEIFSRDTAEAEITVT